MRLSNFRRSVNSGSAAQSTSTSSRRIAAILTASILALLPASRVFAENISLSVRADSPAGTLPTWYGPSAFFAYATTTMKQDFGADAGRTRGMFAETLQFLLGPSTSLVNYQTRLAQSGLAQEAQAIASTGGQLLIQVQTMPKWISSSTVTSVPAGCTGEWPTYQTVAPDPAKWAAWEAAVKATVTYFNITNKLTNVWYQFWDEPDGGCFWTDTQAKYLETWQHFVSAARSVDPNVRVGGPSPGAGPAGVIRGESKPVMQAFIEYSASHGVVPSFISYHTFNAPPEEGRLRNRAVRSTLSANGLGPVPIVVSSWNPNGACYDDYLTQPDTSWPSQPSALGCWQTDTEMGASYALAFMSHLAEEGATGYQVMYTLDDANVGGGAEFPHDWGMRTSASKNGIRKAIYHAHTILGRMPRNMVAKTVTHSNGAQEYFDHLFTLAGVEGDKLGLLVASYVTSPEQQAIAILANKGYGAADIQRWGGKTWLSAFITGQAAVTALTNVPQEQADLQTMKDAFFRQRALVTETNHVTFALSGFPTSIGYQVTRYLIDPTHNNAYATYMSSGLSAAIAGQKLQVLDTQHITSLAQVPAVDLKPYSVMYIEIQRNR